MAIANGYRNDLGQLLPRIPRETLIGILNRAEAFARELGPEGAQALQRIEEYRRRL